jgi:hypothetical protein
VFRTFTSSARSQLVFLLSEITSQRKDSPYYLAFLWLVYFDDAILCPADSGNVDTAVDVDGTITTDKDAAVDSEMQTQRIQQRYTLALLYYAFNGHEWDNCQSESNFYNTTALGECQENDGSDTMRFLDGSHECNWYGVACENVTDANGQYLAVTELVLPQNGLHGSILEEISLLSSLEVLNL